MISQCGKVWVKFLIAPVEDIEVLVQWACGSVDLFWAWRQLVESRIGNCKRHTVEAIHQTLHTLIVDEKLRQLSRIASHSIRGKPCGCIELRFLKTNEAHILARDFNNLNHPRFRLLYGAGPAHFQYDFFPVEMLLPQFAALGRARRAQAIPPLRQLFVRMLNRNFARANMTGIESQGNKG